VRVVEGILFELVTVLTTVLTTRRGTAIGSSTTIHGIAVVVVVWEEVLET
jgi:hypothetical protein